MTHDAWGWCTGITQRDGTGRDVRGGFRMGNMRTPVADSCWCMAKPIQYCKVISLQLNKFILKKLKSKLKKISYTELLFVKSLQQCIAHTNLHVFKMGPVRGKFIKLLAVKIWGAPGWKRKESDTTERLNWLTGWKWKWKECSMSFKGSSRNPLVPTSR